MAGYSLTPLSKKLGFRARMRAAIVRAPKGYSKLLQPLPADLKLLARPAEAMDLIQVFGADEGRLAVEFPALAKRLAVDGMLWVSWPKKTSPMFRGLTEDGVRRIGLAAGLVDVKVCAVDDDWSGLKFVRRLEDRK